MTKYASMRQLQREGSRIVTSLQSGDELILTSRGKQIARIIPDPPQKKVDWDVVKKFAGMYTGIHSEETIKQLRNEWE